MLKRDLLILYCLLVFLDYTIQINKIGKLQNPFFCFVIANFKNLISLPEIKSIKQSGLRRVNHKVAYSKTFVYIFCKNKPECTLSNGF